MTKKYELTDEAIIVGSTVLHRIRALVDIPKYNVKAGDLGGFIEKESNLSHDGECWIHGNARVFDRAWIYDNAYVYGDAWIHGKARVCGNACIVQGKYHVSTMHITVLPYDITAIYPNHVQIGCSLFEICDKKTAIETMKRFNISEKYHEQIWIAVRLCKQWLKDNPEKGDNNGYS